MKILVPNRFNVIRILRENIDSKTFIASDSASKRTDIVVKILRKGHFNRDLASLSRQMSWFGGVRHSNLAVILDAGLTPKGDLYYVREYFPFSELFSVNSLTAVRALTSAVDFLQSNGRIHGAIKPSNIFLNDGCLKLADPQLKMAGCVDEDGEIRFTPPEVLRGEAPVLESDLYSVGAVLYRVLTQRNLFEDSNLAHLRTKCIWASPMPVGNVYDVPRGVSDLVIQLLDKEPQKRVNAFKSLKETVGILPGIVMRAPLIGREPPLDEVLQIIRESFGQGRRVVLIEGTPGIGKSRLLEELQIRCAFEGLLFLKWDCCPTDEVQPMLDRIFEFLKNASSSGRNAPASIARLPSGSDTPHSAAEFHENYQDEKAINEFLILLADFARNKRIVIAFDHVDCANSKTVLLIEQLSLRSAEIPLTLILTQRHGQSDLKLISILNNCLPDEFRRVHLRPLDQMESSQLLRYLTATPYENTDLLHSSGGNPLFIENHVRYGGDAMKNFRQKEAVMWMLKQVSRQARDAAEALSSFKNPVGPEILAEVCCQSIHELKIHLKMLENVGIIQRDPSGLLISVYGSLAKIIYRTLSRRKKLELSRKTFDLLRARHCEIEDLAHYSFEARAFYESGTFHRQLATKAYERNDYKEAAIKYERLQRCERLGGTEFILGDRLRHARSLQMTGRPSKALLILKELLRKDAVHDDPELLSALYRGLAIWFDKTPNRERVRLSQLAIECISIESPDFCLRNLDLAENLIRLGDLSAAAVAVTTASQHVRNEIDSNTLERVRAVLAMNMGDFKGAVSNFLSLSDKNSRMGPTLNNLALCFENLGDLTKAWEFQSKAHDFAVASGMLSRRILTLGNLGSIKTKLGEIQPARRLFEEALASVAQTRRKERVLDQGNFGSIYHDAALYSTQIGSYHRADECLRKAQAQNTTSLLAGDRLFCESVKCYFYLTIGSTKTVRSILGELDKTQISKTPFFQVERSLLEARMPDVSIEEKLSHLDQALKNTHQLGTLYQQCQVLNELSAILISSDEKRRALEFAKIALGLSQRQGYRPLRTRALLLSGIASEKQKGKEQKLLAAFQSASEMGLQEIIAESAFHLGVLHVESTNFVTARDYLGRSVSITETLAAEIPARFRLKYRNVAWRCEARKQLERCAAMLRQQPMYAPSDIEASGGDRYFKAAYTFALSGTATKSPEGLVNQIEETLQTSLARGAVIILKDLKEPIIRGIRIKLSEEILQRVHNVAIISRNRIYFGAPDISRPKETVAWVPLQSDTRDGGIYVVCRQNEPALTEKEMELLAIIGTIGNGALRSLEANQAKDLENTQIGEFHGMIGASKAIREVYSHIEIAAKNTATVLIEGESGTGKELVAKAIHAAGTRAKEPFVAVDCGAIPESLIEAELFGAKKGSYTGAVTDRAGLFEAANRGTIFLDEISNTTPALQARLLRVIQEREVRRIGETRDRPIDVRLIVASNRNLEELVAEGRFRKDLLYRLKVLYFKVPPLRNRREDIPMIAHAFLQKLNAANKLKKYCAPGVLDHLAAQNFPGNVRELQNAVERAYFLSKGSVIHNIAVEDQTSAPHRDEVQSLFKDLSEGRQDFWLSVHKKYKRRDITREKVMALLDLGLRASGGSYKALASKFHLKRNEYRRFMDFLRRNKCLLDFRPYRQAAAGDTR